MGRNALLSDVASTVAISQSRIPGRATEMVSPFRTGLSKETCQREAREGRRTHDRGPLCVQRSWQRVIQSDHSRSALPPKSESSGTPGNHGGARGGAGVGRSAGRPGRCRGWRRRHANRKTVVAAVRTEVVDHDDHRLPRCQRQGHQRSKVATRIVVASELRTTASCVADVERRVEVRADGVDDLGSAFRRAHSIHRHQHILELLDAHGHDGAGRGILVRFRVSHAIDNDVVVHVTISGGVVTRTYTFFPSGLTAR